MDRLLTGAVAALCTAFLLRVGGQALQRWVPQAWLPPFSEWQGSAIPYPALLGAQLVILALLALALTSMLKRRRVLGRRASSAVIGAGALYFAGTITRLLIGIFWLPENVWFTAWISTSFHLILASIVLIWGWHQVYISHCGSRHSARRSCA